MGGDKFTNLQRSSYLFSWPFCETARDRAYHSFIYIWENKGLSWVRGRFRPPVSEELPYPPCQKWTWDDQLNYISIYFKDGVWKQFVGKKLGALRGKICLSDPLWNDIGIIRKKNLRPHKKPCHSLGEILPSLQCRIRAVWRKRDHQFIVFPWKKI